MALMNAGAPGAPLAQHVGPRRAGRGRTWAAVLLVGEPQAEAVWRYLQAIIRERGDYNGRVLSVRRDDARALCAVMHVDEPSLVQRLADWEVLIEE